MSNPQPTRRNEHVPIGKHFLQTGVIDVGQLDAALNYKHEHGVKLGQALVALGFVSETDLVDALRQQGKVHCIHLTPNIVDTRVAMKLGEKESHQKRAIAVNQVAGHTMVAMEDPSDVYVIDELTRRLDSRVLPVFAEPSRIDEALEHVFKKDALKISLPETERAVDKLVEIAREEEKKEPKLVTADTGLRSGKDITFVEGEEPDDEADEDLDKPVINLVRSIFEDAFVKGASDIHLEPRQEDLLVRFRVDGTLFDRTTVPKSWARPILARIKVLANLDIAQRRLPQDGRIQFRYKNNRVDLRVATTPNLRGEAAVLRVLDGGRELHDIEKLDFDDTQREILERITTQRDGFVLATGPTGSGKTTTLYALLQVLNSRDRKIITLEDPVENEMDGIIQINCHHKIGLTFATGLRSILRQDPDIVLVGEIRDGETAQIAIQAAMTGHTVLSTLHTVGAAESVMRLEDMGVEPYLIADTLRGIVAQRLLRRICEECKTELKPDQVTRKRLGLGESEEVTFYQGRGCDACHGTGYSGRIGIYEVLEVAGDVRRLIETGAGTKALISAMQDNGTTTLREDGMRKALAGITTIQEVLVATHRG
jgi:type IV pilus assembly protein PilB